MLKLLVIVVSALTMLACGERYKYVEGRNGTVRIDRTTGRSEILGRTSTGAPVWRVVSDPGEAAAPAALPPAKREITVAANDPGLRVEAGTIGAGRPGFQDPTDAVYGTMRPLTVSVSNNTGYDLSAIRLRLQYREAGVVETVGPVRRGQSAAYEIPLRGPLEGWHVVGATGIAIQ